MRLKDKVAIVTGGANGIGAAVARLYIAEGAKVFITDVQVEAGRALAEELGGRAHFLRHDVSDAQSWQDVVAAATGAGRIDILVNNAGVAGNQQRIDELTEERYRRVIDINQVGTFLGIKAVVPSMIAAGGGSIVNTSSVYGLVGAERQIDYCASKFAVTGMTKAAAMELGDHKIRVNCVHPGATRTAMTHQGIAAVGLDHDGFVADFAIKRWADAVEVAQVYVFLGSDEASFCTGASFAIDGGLSAR